MIRPRHRLSTLILGGVAATSLLLSACGSDTLSSSSSSTSGGESTSQASVPSTITVTADPALVAALPDKIAQSKKIVVGIDPSYAPNEMFAADGKTVEGMNPDLFTAFAQQFGVEVQYEPAVFDAIILGVNSGKFDAGVSSFSINPERKQQVNMVSYFNAGTQWVVGKGKDIDPDNACGKTVAVQKGTTQLDDITARSTACEDANKAKITVLASDKQTDVTASVISGKADAMLADSPIALYAVKQNPDTLEPAGGIYDAAPYGIILPKDETEFADAMAKAAQATKDNGEYDRILGNWGQESGAVDSFQVNP